MTTPTVENKQAYDARLAEIRNDPDLSDQAKQRLAGEAYEKAMKRHNELIAEAEVAGEVGHLEKKIFAIPYPVGATSGPEREAINQSYRDAAFKVSGKRPAELERILERAERTGDLQLAKAVYHESLERGIEEVRDRYLASRPEDKSTWEAYAEAQKRLEIGDSELRAAKSYPPRQPHGLSVGAPPAQAYR